MTRRYKVSIIIPVYNSSTKLEKCIESAISQSEQELEIILVNDGSTDDSGSICDRYAENDPRIKVIHQENQGPGPARNKGLSVASGEYIYFLDSDDHIDPHLIRDNYQTALKNSSDIVVFGYQKEEKEGGKKIRITTSLKELSLNDKTSIQSKLVDILDSGATFAVWNKLFKREMIESHEIRFPSFRRNQDMAFTLYCFKNSKSIAVNPGIYYFYKYDAFNFKYDQQMIDNHLKIYDLFYKLFDGWMDAENNRQYALKLFTMYFFHAVPFHIVLYEEKPVSAFKKMVTHQSFIKYLNLFKVQEAPNRAIQLALIILKTGNPYILYSVSKLKLMLSDKLGKNLFRSLFNR